MRGAARPLLSLTVKPNSTADRQKLHMALETLTVEDPTLHFENGVAAGEVVVAGPGESQLESAIERVDAPEPNDEDTST